MRLDGIYLQVPKDLAGVIVGLSLFSSKCHDDWDKFLETRRKQIPALLSGRERKRI